MAEKKIKQSTWVSNLFFLGTLPVICQVNYAENFALVNQNQVRSAYWTKKYVSIFTAYAWLGGSDDEGQPFGLVLNSTKMINMLLLHV